MVGMEKGLITLVLKEGGRGFNNWRPVSLLNFDYKLFAEGIAEWLEG